MSYNSVEDYVKNAESNRNPAVLNSLLESEPGMKELPEITTEDEGKILQVNNGKPSWSSGGSSGGGALRVNMTVEDGDAVLDKTWEEIVEAIKGGVLPYVYEDNNGIIGNIFYIYKYEDDIRHATYNVSIKDNYGTSMTFTTSSKTGYPIHSDPGVA